MRKFIEFYKNQMSPSLKAADALLKNLKNLLHGPPDRGN
jgi:hypothetical protein